MARAMRLANFADELKVSTPEALERAAELEAAREKRIATRREFLGNVARTAAAAGVAALAGPLALSGTARAAGSPSIGIVGAGLAGLVCAETLRAKGHLATVYEAETSRVGGRCWSMPDFLPGMTIEHGGQFIDNLHKQMLHRVPAECTLGDFGKVEGEIDYFTGGVHYHESEIVDRFRDFSDAIRIEVQNTSGEVTADSHTEHDERIDNTSITAFLDGQNQAGIVADPVLRAMLISAYDGEYGLDCAEQSALNLIHFIHHDKRSKMAWFGVYSDERYYVTQGNDRIAKGVAAGLPGQIQGGKRLTAARRLGDGRIELTFSDKSTAVHDAVVFAVPFTVLRASVSLHSSLGLSPEKKLAIDELGYGTNAKMAIGFGATPWRNPAPTAPDGFDGTCYTYGLRNTQVVFGAAPHEGTSEKAILVDYSSGPRGARLRPSRATQEAESFLSDYDKVVPGVKAAARRDSRGNLTHVRLDHWPSNPNTLGSYTCYRTGQFTTICGNEGKQEGNLYFAGEHADSFYSWQGFMEGACLSGARVAAEILQDVKVGNL
jgi:monoamine oxidase